MQHAGVILRRHTTEGCVREVLPTSHTSSLTWHQPARGTDEALPSAVSAVKNDGEAAAVYAQRAGKPLLRLAATTSARQAARGRARREVLHARNVETLARRIKQAFTGKSTESLPQRWRTQPRRARTSFLATGDGTRRDIFFVQNVKLKKKKKAAALRSSRRRWSRDRPFKPRRAAGRARASGRV